MKKSTIKSPDSVKIAGALHNRLNAFFVEARTHFQKKSVVRPQNQQIISIDKLRDTFRKINAPLAEMRIDGALLNVWKASGLKRDEVRNSSALAALLDPQQIGSDAKRILKEFLNRLRWSGNAPLPSHSQLEEPYRVAVETNPYGQESNRIDLSIEGSTFFLYIEIKIDAVEGEDQIDRYIAVMKSRADVLLKQSFFIYLSPRSSKKFYQEVTHANWKDIATAVRNVSRSSSDINSRLLKQFAEHVKHF